jgi:hypothetical protein
MIFFDELEYAKIPIWENKRRIKALKAFGDLYKDTLRFPPRVPLAGSTTGQPPMTSEERHSEINRRKPTALKIVALAQIRSFRATLNKDGKTIDIDVLARLWDLERHGISTKLPVDVVEEAIGVYHDDQVKSLVRTLNPFFWLGRLIDWIADGIFNGIVALFGGNPNDARSSNFGRMFTKLERLTLWTATVVGAVIAVLEFLGFQTPIRHILHLQ